MNLIEKSLDRESKEPDWNQRQATLYAEAGDMLRHYSNSRSSVLAIILPACVAILGWGVATADVSVTYFLLIAEGVLYASAVCLSMFFAVRYEKTRRALMRLEAGENVNLFSELAGSRGRLQDLSLDGINKCLILIGSVFHVLFFIAAFS